MLWERVEDSTLFQAFEWNHAAWQWCRESSELYTLVFRKSDCIVAIIPLVKEIQNKYGMKLNVIRELSVPDNQSYDALVLKKYRSDVARTLTDNLLKKNNAYDVLELKKLTSSSFFLSNILPIINHSPYYNHRQINTGLVPLINLDNSWDAYYSKLSRRLKKGNNLIRNKLKRTYASIEIKWFNSESCSHEDMAEAVKNYIAISSSSWKTKTGTSLNNPGPNRFIETLSSYSYERKWLSIWLLYLDGKVVAGEYQIICKRQIYALRSDFIKGYESSSPGTFLNWKMLERIFEEKYITYEMGPGRNSYKDRWADRYDERATLIVYSRSLKGHLLALFERSIIPYIKNMRDKIRSIA